MYRIERKQSRRKITLLTVFYILLLQNPLEDVIPICTYIDELFPLVGVAVFVYKLFITKKIRTSKTIARITLLIIIFLCSGLLGNIIYRYQPIQAVLIDFYTHLKFWLSIYTGYILFDGGYSDEDKRLLLRHVKFALACLFLCLLADYLFHIFPSPEKRYGIRVEKLFFSHPTFLAASAVFLLSMLTVFYENTNKPHIAMGLVLLFSTLRGKAMAGALVYVLIHYFLIQRKQKLRARHFLLLFLAVIFVGKDLFSTYYIAAGTGESARRELTITSVKMMADYFPIGSGFGTYGSAASAEYYSPIYLKYGLNHVWGLSKDFYSFVCDTFWPVIIGQTGIIGLICYATALVLLFFQVLRLRKANVYSYASGIFIMAYLMISSTSEAAFNNAISVPLAMIIGSMMTQTIAGNTGGNAIKI